VKGNGFEAKIVLLVHLEWTTDGQAHICRSDHKRAATRLSAFDSPAYSMSSTPLFSGPQEGLDALLKQGVYARQYVAEITEKYATRIGNLHGGTKHPSLLTPGYVISEDFGAEIAVTHMQERDGEREP
jgi:hypothetical protein